MLKSQSGLCVKLRYPLSLVLEGWNGSYVSFSIALLFCAVSSLDIRSLLVNTSGSNHDDSFMLRAMELIDTVQINTVRFEANSCNPLAAIQI